MDSRLRSSRPTFRATSTNSGTGCRQGATFLRRCGGSISRRRMGGRDRWAYRRWLTASLRRSPDATWSRSWSRCFAVPEFVEVARKVGLELRNRLSIHASRSLVGLHMLEGLPDFPFRNLERLCLVHGLLPFPVGQWPRPNNAAPSLQPQGNEAAAALLPFARPPAGKFHGVTYPRWLPPPCGRTRSVFEGPSPRL